jgi:hypothetical protein
MIVSMEVSNKGALWQVPGDSGGVSSAWHVGRETSGTWETHASPGRRKADNQVGKANCTKVDRRMHGSQTAS